MRLLLSCLPRLLPLATPLLAFSTAEKINAALNCSSLGKRPEPCLALGLDLAPYLGAMFWWGVMLWIPGLLVSGVLLSRFLGAPALTMREEECSSTEGVAATPKLEAVIDAKQERNTVRGKLQL